MFSDIVAFLNSAVQACFDWYTGILDKFPGAWTTILTIFTIFVIARYLLGPVLGATFGGFSDKARKINDRRRYVKESYMEMKGEK